MCYLSGLQIMFCGHIFDTTAQNFCQTVVFQTFENSVGLTILLSCNPEGLFFDFYLNRKVGWRRIVVTYLGTVYRQYIGRNAS